MFELHVFADARILARALSETIERTRVDVFEDVHVMTPNQTMGGYVELALARYSNRQIVANVHFRQLESFFSSMVSRIPSLSSVKVLNRDILQGLILERLGDSDFLERPEMRDVLKYVDPPEVRDLPEARETRTYQLAARMAGAFSDYSYARPKMVKVWSQGHAYLGDEPVERWQRCLWASIFDQDLVARCAETRLMFLYDALNLAGDEELRKVLPKRLHFFGFPFLSQTLKTVYARLGRLCNVHYYALLPVGDSESPCEGMKLWGATALASLEMLRELAEHQPQTEFTPSQELTVLQSLREALIDCEAPGQSEDGSVTLLKCSGVQREIEVVANHIWSKLDADATLHMGDFAVIIASPDYSEYLSQIDTVFRAFHDLRYSVSGRKVNELSRVMGGVQALLELPLGEFTRSQVMGCLMHPNVQVMCPDADPQAWLSWCESTGIFHGHSHAAHENTYIRADVYNWDQGLRRLALGGFLSGRASGQDEFYVSERGQYLPEEVRESGLGTAAAFNLFARSLIQDALWIRQQRMPMKKWAECLHKLTEIYIGPDRSDVDVFQTETGELTLIGLVLGRIAEQDFTESVVGYRTATLILLAALERVQMRASRSHLSAVAVGKPDALLGIPFRHIFMVGMGEGQFPAPARPSPLDLRETKPEPGDVTPNARDRFAFLQTIMAAQDSLNVSWVSRDSTTGDPLQPASVVSEMTHWMRSLDLGVRTEEHPLRRFDRARGYFSGGELAQNHHPEAYQEAVLAALHEDLKAHFAREEKILPPAWKLNRVLANQEIDDLYWLSRRVIQYGTKRSVLSIEEKPRSLRPTRVSFSRLKQFLQSPLQGVAKYNLGYLDEEDLLGRDAESFGKPIYSYVVILRDFLIHELCHGRVGRGDLEGRFRSYFDFKAEVRGELPTGLFRELNEPRMLDLVRSWEEGLAGFNEPTIYSANTDVEEEQTRLDLPILRIKNGLEVELFGVMPPLVENKFLCVASVKNIESKYGLDAYVAHLVLSLAQDKCGTVRTAFVRGTGGHESMSLNALSQSEAEETLLSILNDMMLPEEVFMMPLEVLEKFLVQKKNPQSFEYLLQKHIPDPHKRGAYKYGPLRDFETFGPPESVVRRAERYFRAFRPVERELGRQLLEGL